MRKSTFKEIYLNNKEIFDDLFFNKFYSITKIAEYFNVCNNVINKIIKEYDLKRDNNKVISNSLYSSEAKKKQWENILKSITKEDIVEWYIKEDHGYDEAPSHWGITQWQWDKLCKYYNIKKDRSKSRIKFLSSISGEEKQKYWKNVTTKQQETRVEHYGSVLESYRQQQFKIRQTNMERYGATSYLLSDKMEFKKKYTQPNNKFASLLDKNNIKYEREFVIEDRSYDFKINKILIEINPTITHNLDFNPFNKLNNYKGIENKYHLNKTKLAEKHGYRCIHIWEWEDQNKIISLLKPRPTIGARKCEVKEINLYNAREFINTYHIQGYARCKIKLGLYFKDKLISIMTFGKPRFNNKYEWELIRYCSSYNVIGGAEKLFNYFIKEYSPSSIISYCDNSKFEGKIYYQLGFNLKSKGCPGIIWSKPNTNIHYSDSLIRSKGFSRIINKCEPEEDNLDTSNNYILMNKAGFLRVEDCGQSLYEWKK